MGAMNELKVLDPNGHTRTTWDTASPEEIESDAELNGGKIKQFN